MDDKQRRALVKALNVSNNFESNYSEKNRAWFLDKVIRGLEAEGVGDSAIESKTREAMQKAKTLVKANRDFSLSVKAAGNSRFTTRALAGMRRHRVEILYGAIAINREFLEPQHLKYLLLISRRRFRSICRMFYWVNPNYQGFFRYDHTCKANEHWRVNEDADDFWEEVTPPMFSNYSPWKLNSAGRAEPVKAIEKLFTRKKDPCKGNLFDCETTTSMVFIDSLREAKDEDQFVDALASTGSEYLLIHGFKTDGHTTNFFADTSTNGLFTALPVPAVDLQVGDQCYIFNHPLYKTFRPTGAWTGEYSLVYALGNRNYRSKSGFTFGGHGKEGTLYKFYDDFLAELKNHLAAARQFMRAHLAFMRGGAPAIVPGTVKEEEHDIEVEGNPATAYRLLEYDKNVAAKDYSKIPPKTSKKPRRTAPAFVVVQSKTEHLFYLEHIDTPDERKPLISNVKKRITDIVPPGVLRRPVKFKRIEPPPSGASLNVIYALDKWGVAFKDKSTGTEKVWPMFELKSGKLQRKELTHNDLFESPFSLYAPDKTDLDVGRPRVNFGSAHQSFLTSNGAL
jgi:hypothetical protein